MRIVKMADTKFWKTRNTRINQKKIPSGQNTRERFLAVPYPNAKQVLGPPQQHVIPKTEKKKFELIFTIITKNNSTKWRRNKPQNYWQYRTNLHH